MQSMQLFRNMAAYNRWINERFYGLCEAVPDHERKKDRGAVFKSIHGTLNHLLLTDRLWLSRFRDAEFHVPSLEHILFSEFADLRRERGVTDAEIERYVDSLKETDLEGEVSFFSRVQNRRCRYPRWHALQHFFNHQTHHRGQLTVLLSQLGVDYGAIDLLWLPGREL